jgi:hypothetical protein
MNALERYKRDRLIAGLTELFSSTVEDREVDPDRIGFVIDDAKDWHEHVRSIRSMTLHSDAETCERGIVHEGPCVDLSPADLFAEHRLKPYVDLDQTADGAAS